MTQIDKFFITMGIIFVILIWTLLWILPTCLIVDKGSDQYYYNQIKTEHPNWHHNAIEDNLFFTPYCDSVAYFVGPHNDETYYYKGDTLYFMNNLTGEQIKIVLKDTL